MAEENGAVRLHMAGPPGVPGRLQHSRDLSAWTDWLPVIFGEGPLEISDPDAPSNAAGFYRLVVP